MFKKLLIIIFNWALKEKLSELDTAISEISTTIRRCETHEKRLKRFMDNVDITVDVNEDRYAKSWAVISIQGEPSDFIKFIDLGRSDVVDIQRFLSNFDRRRIKADASPRASKFLRVR